jgi:hypothetical protein
MTSSNTSGSETMNNGKSNFWSLIVIGAIILISVTYAAVTIHCPNSVQSYILHVLLSLGAGFLGACIPGKITIRTAGKNMFGGVACFFLVFTVNPTQYFAQTADCDFKTVTLIVVVHGEKGIQDILLRSQGQVMLDILPDAERSSGARRSEPINYEGQALFEGIPVGSKVKCSVEFSEQYHVVKPDTTYTVYPQSKIFLKVALAGLDKISGRVFYLGNPLSETRVLLSDLVAKTDSNGFYKIIIPKNYQQKQQTLTFIKSGYPTKKIEAYPETCSPCDVDLGN